jgi:hypothetical protein
MSHERLSFLEKFAQRLISRISKLEKLSNKYTALRLAIFVIGTSLAIIAFSSFGKLIGSTTLAIFIIAFFIAVFFHNKVTTSIARHKILLNLKLQNIARIKLDWEILAPKENIVVENHPFASDLDILGKNSLYRLLDTTVSQEGEECLLGLLLEKKPELAKILKRQSIIKELKNLNVLRNKIILDIQILKKPKEHKWHGKKILPWVAQDEDLGQLKKVLNTATFLLVTSYILFILSSFLIPALYWKLSFALYAIHFFLNDKHVKTFFKDAINLEYEIRKLYSVIGKLEKFDFGNYKNLTEFCQVFKKEEVRPSEYVRRIKNLVASASFQSNPMIWLLSNAIFPWDFFHAYRLKRYKKQIAEILPIWLDKLFEFDAMISLANFAYINPDYIFPTILEENAETPQFDLVQVGHPLLKKEKKVCNDFSMQHKGDVIIITGSNMAGKSTFLRTLGSTLCLAYAGTVVNAESFNTKVLRLFTCIKVSDSVTDGLSYFYAEVKRLKALLSALEEKEESPLFFLVDEIFKGTNNKERLLGSRAYIKALANKNGLGFISTHDLELVKLEEEIDRIKNYHFRDDVLDNKMTFSYKIYKGPCPTTNALKIMEIEGLPT